MISSDKEELFVIILLGIILWPIVIAGLIAFAIGYLLYKLIVPKK
jgi:nitrate reductase NapE component